MSSFDLMAIIQELQTLVGGRFDKAYQTNDEISIRISSKEVGKKEIFSKAGKWLLLREPKRGEGQPGAFAMVLRKHLSNAFFSGAEQHDFDRVAVLHFEKRDNFQLIFELFSRGNTILVQEGKILNHLRRESWSAREIKIGEVYKFPPSRVNPKTVVKGEFESILRESEKDLVRTLALDMNLGGQYSEELCLRLGLDKKSPAGSISSEDAQRIHDELQKILQDVQENMSPRAVLEEGEHIDATPIPLMQYEEFETGQTDSMSSALEFLISSLEEDLEEVEEEDEIARFERRIRQQEDAIEKSLEKEERFRGIAEYLHSNPSELTAVLEDLANAAPNELVESVDYDKATAVLTLPDGKRFTLEYRKGLFENADTYFQKAKKEKSKRERLKEEISKSKREMEKAEKRIERKDRLPKIEPTKQFWFDSYRWFISSEGNLVIAGRDAKSNDRIVKRHLKEGDRYAHAEIKGAPSVIVKNGSNSTEVTLKEACEFASSFSKAWNLKLGGGTAYWVKPEQVSKRPESGEFLPKGAFVIRGKRNHYKDLELEVAVGEVLYEGERKVMCGPRSAVESQSKRFIVLRPGNVKKDEMAKELSQLFQVPIEEIARILPPGGFEMVERRI